DPSCPFDSPGSSSFSVLSVFWLPPVWRSPRRRPPPPKRRARPSPAKKKTGPPASKTLDRAKKLYDKGDYYSASIELDKSLKGNEDSEPNKQKAAFFMGKTLFHLKYYAAALVRFDGIVQKGPSHRYYRRTLQWLAALAEVLPESAGILKK